MPLLLYLTAIGVRPAYATDADAPQVIIDDMHFPTLVVEAHNAKKKIARKMNKGRTSSAGT